MALNSDLGITLELWFINSDHAASMGCLNVHSSDE